MITYYELAQFFDSCENDTVFLFSTDPSIGNDPYDVQVSWITMASKSSIIRLREWT